MAAFLPVAFLRAHEAPDFLTTPTGRSGQSAELRPAPRARAVLTARWVAAPDGRLACRRQARAPARLRPPPD